MQSPAEGVQPGGLTPAQLLALLLPPQGQTQLLLHCLELRTQVQSRVRPWSRTWAHLSAKLLEPRRLLSDDLTELARRVLEGECWTDSLITASLFSLRFCSVPLPHLNILVSGAEGSEQILDLLLVLPGLMGPISQHFLEEAVFKLEADLQLLQNVVRSRVDPSQQGAAQILQQTGGNRWLQTSPNFQSFKAVQLKLSWIRTSEHGWNLRPGFGAGWQFRVGF